MEDDDLDRLLEVENEFDADEAQRNYQSIKGIWTDANGTGHKIVDMETRYIANCMRMLEKKMWHRINGLTHDQIEHRAMVGGALQAMNKYRELEAEFMKRVKSKKVTLGDLFMAIKAKNVRVIK